ncbi:MAG: NHLP-related RiPP peptide [Xanthomonadales bacterium]|nr:NHLP-related RiPP peptide [Xanthomonadales bacterium]
MSNVLLDGPLGESLIRRLAGDDDFRALFARNPIEGLRQIGLSPQQMMQLSPRCLSPQEAAPKAVFEKILSDIGGESFRLAMSFSIHHLKVQMSESRELSAVQTLGARSATAASGASAGHGSL